MSEGQQKPIIKQVIQYLPTKYFISSLNTYFGQHLVQRLRNDHLHPENPHRIIGTNIAAQSKYHTPPGVKKVIDTGKVQFFEDILLNSDVIVYDLNTCDLKEAEFALSTLKLHNFEGEKVLICISNVMTWARSRPKQKKQGDEQENDENPAEEADSEEENQEAAEGEEKKTYVRYTDKDYVLRKPAPQYEQIKSIETLCLAAGNAKPSLKSYVVCSGILYGAGEVLFQNYFMQARLQIPHKLPYYGKGKNRIPGVHVQDLVTYIEKIIEKKPKIPYLIAIDHNPKPTQKKIIQAISKGIGTGQIESLPISQAVENIDILTLNLRMKPTMIFAKIEQEEAAIQVQEGSEVVKFKFNWKAKEGIQKNLQNLRRQYIGVHDLRQEKILIIGPPGSGKTFYAKKLAQKYYLPHIHIKSVIEQIKSLKNEFSQEIMNFLNEKKEAQISTKQSEYQEAKEKLKKIPKQIRPYLEPFNPDTVDVRLSEQLVYKCYKWRLTQNDCLNRGYILDGYPKKYDDAKEIFMSLPVVEGEEGGDQNAKKVVDERLVPNKFITLEMTDVQIIDRLQKFPEEQIAKTHLTENKIKRLLKIYRQANDISTGELILEDFFKENKISSHHVTVSSQTQSLIESIISPLPVNESEEQGKIMNRLSNEKLLKQDSRKEMDKKENIVRDVQNEDYIMKKENQQNEERQILDKKSLALRKYLDVNLVPILSEGIAEILSKFPKDPVDMLAEFLFKNSLKVANPDPSTFEF